MIEIVQFQTFTEVLLATLKVEELLIMVKENPAKLL